MICHYLGRLCGNLADFMEFGKRFENLPYSLADLDLNLLVCQDWQTFRKSSKLTGRPRCKAASLPLFWQTTVFWQTMRVFGRLSESILNLLADLNISPLVC